jgi:adenosine deaminase
VVKTNINLHSLLEMTLHFKQGMEVYIRLYHFISSREWRFIFVFTTSFQAGNGGLYSSLPLHFKQGMEVYIRLYHLHFKRGMEVYIHLYHFISSGEWRFIFVFTTSFQVGNGGLYSSLPLHYEVIRTNINLQSPLEM